VVGGALSGAVAAVIGAGRVSSILTAPSSGWGISNRRYLRSFTPALTQRPKVSMSPRVLQVSRISWWGRGGGFPLVSTSGRTTDVIRNHDLPSLEPAPRFYVAPPGNSRWRLSPKTCSAVNTEETYYCQYQGVAAVAVRVRLLVLAVTVAMIAVLNPVSTTIALAKCDPGRSDNGTSYWTGWYRYATSPTGVGSDILNYDPWVHYSDDVVSAWTMLASGSLYAQIGWIEYPFGYRYMFTEYTTSDGAWHRKLYTAQSVNSVHRYTTLFGGGVFTFQLDGVTGSTVPAQFTPDNAQNFGEIHTLDDQMPGATSAHETFRNTQINYGGGWHPFAGSGSINPYYSDFHYTTSDSGQYALDIWDGKCSS